MQDFAMHINGAGGSPYPFLSNPSSCAASQFGATFGDPDLHSSTPAPVPYQATGCPTVPFTPTFNQTFSSTTAGTETSTQATVTVPAGNSSIKSMRVVEPPVFGPNYPAFGTGGDQCPDSSAPLPTSLFDPTACVAQSKVGHMTVNTPLLPLPLVGDIYLISKTPLPWFGVKLLGQGVDVRLVGTTSLPPVDLNCDSSAGFCQQQISVQFFTIPDLTVSSILFDLSGPSRAGINNSLSGNILAISGPGDSSCVSPSAVKATIAPSTGTAAVVINEDVPIIGC